MVHQNILCYKDLTLRYFVVSSTSDKLEKCVHGVELLCSMCRNLYRTRSIRRQHKFFVFIWRKLLLNCTEKFREAYGGHTPSQHTCEWWFQCFKSGDFEVADKEHEKPPKNLKMWQFWTKIIRKHKNNSLSEWVLINKLFSIDYERWEKIGRPIDGFTWVLRHANGKTQTCKNTCDILLVRYKKESHSYRRM